LLSKLLFNDVRATFCWD